MPSTTDTAHLSRSKDKVGNIFNFSSDILFDMKRCVPGNSIEQTKVHNLLESKGYGK